MIRHHAAWVVPVSGPPVRDGWVVTDGDRVVAVGRGADERGTHCREVDLGLVAIMPGLVNAHTHLELSCLRGRVPRSASFVDWLRALIAARRDLGDTDPEAERRSIAPAIQEAAACGTALLGDISNTLASVEPLEESGQFATVFYELIRFNVDDAEAFVERACAATAPRGGADRGRVRVTLAAHAPYSVAPQLFQAIAAAVGRNGSSATSVHLAESVEEMLFVRNGSGPWRDLLERLGAWDSRWSAPGISPVAYLDGLGFLGPRTLAVHGVQMSPADLAILSERQATLVTCPRSNLETAAGAPPVPDFYKSGVRVAVGTDSLAGVPDLNVFAELAALRSLAPDVPASALIDSATRQGARALGFEAECGTIERGRRARLITVSLPPGVDDVEEYLVGGIDRGQIRWLET